MDMVGFEPTTKAQWQLKLLLFTYLKWQLLKEYYSNPTRSAFFFDACSIALTVKGSFKKS
jgi:hypothetical protein